MNKSESIAKLSAALVKASAELSNPPFDSTNPHFKNKYASLAGTRDHLNSILSKFGLTVSQLVGSGERGPTVETMLIHESGEWISERLEMPASKQDAQGWGSATTYARRYALMGICGVVGDVDDDGNEASKPAKASKENGKTPATAWENMPPAKVEAKGSISPTDGALDALHSDERGRAQNIAERIVTLWRDDMKFAAYEQFYEAGLSNELKLAIWEILKPHSSIRNELKKMHKQPGAA